MGALPKSLLPILFILAGLQRLCAQTVDAFNPSPNNVVYALALQPDGKVNA
jgi:hypothetical protein